METIINNPWVLCGIGTLFCLSGVYFFYRLSFEENRSVLGPILTIVMGIILIGIGTAKYYHLT